jgi:hypothetical protein
VQMWAGMLASSLRLPQPIAGHSGWRRGHVRRYCAHVSLLRE